MHLRRVWRRGGGRGSWYAEDEAVKEGAEAKKGREIMTKMKEEKSEDSVVVVLKLFFLLLSARKLKKNDNFQLATGNRQIIPALFDPDLLYSEL